MWLLSVFAFGTLIGGVDGIGTPVGGFVNRSGL
jgi:hypothetical protein